MKRAVVLLFFAFSLHAQLPSFSDPSLSPSGEVAFASGGDIWSVPLSGGDARLLVSHSATESRPLWSPDGKQLAFVSTRTGNGDIYVLDLASGDTRRITYDDGTDKLDAWSSDGKWLYFSSVSRDVSGMNDIWRVAATGGTPMQVSAERYVNEFLSAPSPDGTHLALTALGLASSQWWRHGHSHIDESQLWLLDLGSMKYEPLTEDGARELWPMWSADGKRIWFVSDRGGNENIWSLTPGEKPKQVTSFKSGRVLWPTIAYDGRTIVFERDFGIWKLDTSTGSASQISIARLGSPATTAVDHRKLTDRFGSFDLSQDSKKIAFVARGDVWAASAKEGGDAVRITNTSAAEADVTWSPDSKSLVYTSDRSGIPHLVLYDFATEKETELTSGSSIDSAPRFSPDGKSIAFVRGRTKLAVLDVASKQVREIATGSFDMPPLGSERAFDWSPDNKWIAYLNYDPRYFRNAYVVSAAGGDSKPVSFIANTQSDTLSWSRDGKFITMSTGQRTEPSRIARIDLGPQTPKLKEEQFRELFQSKPEEKKDGEKKDEKKTPDVTIDFAGIRERLRLLPIGLDAGESIISPDGKWIAFTAAVGEDENVYAYSIDELAEPGPPKQLSTTSGHKRQLRFSSDSKEVWYLDGGKIVSATIDTARTKPLAVSAETDIEFVRERDEAFRETWTWLRDNFFDPKMNGVDWTAMRDVYAPRVQAAATPDEFRRLMNLMIGELNASHSGANPPSGSAVTVTGRIGVRFDRDAYEKDGTLKISEVVSLSPADIAKLKAGDIITAVDHTPVAGNNFDRLLTYKIGKRTVITVAPGRDVILQPVSFFDEKQLSYRQWVNANRDYVDRISNHRLGYVHMIDMGSESLAQLYIDLDAATRTRDGVVIDVRNNNGGFVNVYAIDVLSRRSYLNMSFRDQPTASARSILGQRSLEKPTILVTNRHSLSDAEDFAEGFRALGVGKIVGEPTAGWIIYTSDVPLIEGTSLRLPFIRVTDAKGQDMEMHPRPVDVFALRQLGEGLAGHDTQLDTAVKTLLEQVK